MQANNNQSDNTHVEKNSTIQMSNSLANKQIMEKSHAENKSKFLVGSYTTQNSYLHTITYDADKNDITTREVMNFEKVEKNEKIINEITGIYNTIIAEESLSASASNDTNYFVQVFNQTDMKYQLKMIKNIDAEEDIGYVPINASDNDHIFDVKHFHNFGSNSENNKVYLISKDKIDEIDLNSDDISNRVEILKLSQHEVNGYPLKICSDGSKLDPKHIAIGINETLNFVDLNSNKLISKVEKAHYNGILSCEFDPFKSFVLSTSGMDYSIKFWDVRKLSAPFATILNNSHWIWDLKYNKHFSRVMIHSSSSSIVRGIISSFKESEDISNVHDQTHVSANTIIDYVEFEDSVYSLDWSLNDPWIFAAVSYNSFVHINSIPEDIKYQVMLDN